MTTENLHFEIGLSGTYWDKKPQYSILVDGKVIKSGTATDSEILTFDLELEETDHVLSIRLENKENSDTVQDDNNNIVNDMLLNINSMSLDNIDISNLMWTKSKYVLDTPAEIKPGEFITEYASCTNLGHNGSWNFAFSSPFYLWLLENL